MQTLVITNHGSNKDHEFDTKLATLVGLHPAKVEGDNNNVYHFYLSHLHLDGTFRDDEAAALVAKLNQVFGKDATAELSEMSAEPAVDTAPKALPPAKKE